MESDMTKGLKKLKKDERNLLILIIITLIVIGAYFISNGISESKAKKKAQEKKINYLLCQKSKCKRTSFNY